MKLEQGQAQPVQNNRNNASSYGYHHQHQPKLAGEPMHLKRRLGGKRRLGQKDNNVIGLSHAECKPWKIKKRNKESGYGLQRENKETSNHHKPPWYREKAER